MCEKRPVIQRYNPSNQLLSPTKKLVVFSVVEAQKNAVIVGYIKDVKDEENVTESNLKILCLFNKLAGTRRMEESMAPQPTAPVVAAHQCVKDGNWADLKLQKTGSSL